MSFRKIKMLALGLFVMAVSVGCQKTESPMEDVYGDKDKVETVKTVEVPEPQVEAQSIHVVTPAGSPAISLLQMMDVKEKSDSSTVHFEIMTSTEALKSKIISEEADAAIVPTNLASVLYNKGIDYKIAATGIWGNLYLVANKEIALEELGDTEIVAFGQSLTPDILLRYLLKEKGIDVEQLNIRYVGGASEVAPLFLTDQAEIALVPEPMLSKIKMKKKDAAVIMDLQSMYKEVTGSELSYPQASLIVKGKLIEERPDVVNNLVQSYENSINYLHSNSEEAAVLGESKEEIGLSKGIILSSLPGSNISFASAQDAKESINRYLSILMEFNPKTIGGKLPDEHFYYGE